jgi:lipid-binding SYLF domain-containing protein
MQKVSTLQFAVLSVFALGSCSTAPESAEGKGEIKAKAEIALSTAQTQEPAFTELCHSSVGQAVFPRISKGAAGVGGAYGKGVLYENDQVVGYCDMTQASIGLQLGGQTYTEIICFENKEALNKFKASEMAFDAQASAVALEAGAGRNFKYTDGVAVVTTDEKGLMAEASLGGQKFTYQAR